MKAMILAAGRGKRLRPITDGCPKPLIKINHKPLIGYHLEALAKAGVTDVVINVAHLKDQIMQTLKDGAQYGLNIHYSVEEQAIGTGGGIKKALSQLGSEPFILVNGDIYTDFDFSKLPSKPSRLAHLVLVPNPPYRTQGDFRLTDDLIDRYHESDPSYTYTGIALISPKLFDQCQSMAFPLPALLHQAILSNELSGEVFQGLWTDVGTIERLKSLEEMLKEDQLQKKAN